MTTTATTIRVDVAVVGGGMAGLVAATVAARAGARCVVIESRPLGGRARTDQRGGFTFNRGPRALYLGGPAERTLRALGVDTASGGAPVTRRGLAVRAGVGHRFPDAPGALVSTSLVAGSRSASFRALAPLLREPKGIPDDASLADWLDARRVRGVARELVEALVRLSTYVDAPDLLPASVAVRAAWMASTSGVRYLDGGFGSLAESLADAADASGVEVVHASATALARTSGRWTVGAEQTTVDASAVVLAVGTPAAAVALLGHRPAPWGDLGPTTTASCLELGTDAVPERRFALGIDEPTYLSVHAPPARLAPEGGAVVHVMRYRRPGEASPPDATRAQLERLVGLTGIDPATIVEQRYLHEMVTHGAIPTVTSGGLAGRPAVAVAELPGLHLAGDWVGPTGLLLDAAVASALDAGRQAARRCATMSVP